MATFVDVLVFLGGFFIRLPHNQLLNNGMKMMNKAEVVIISQFIESLGYE